MKRLKEEDFSFVEAVFTNRKKIGIKEPEKPAAFEMQNVHEAYTDDRVDPLNIHQIRQAPLPNP